MKITIRNARLAFPSLFDAKTVNGEGTPAYSATLLIEKSDPQLKAINEAIDKAAAEKWGVKAAAQVTALRKADKICLHDGEMKSAYAGFEGCMYISARNVARPTVVDADKRPLVAADGRPYAGCYINAILDLWVQDNNYGKRINATLMGVQFARHGESFTGGGAATADDFEDVSEGVTADDLA